MFYLKHHVTVTLCILSLFKRKFCDIHSELHQVITVFLPTLCICVRTRARMRVSPQFSMNNGTRVFLHNKIISNKIKYIKLLQYKFSQNKIIRTYGKFVVNFVKIHKYWYPHVLKHVFHLQNDLTNFNCNFNLLPASKSWRGLPIKIKNKIRRLLSGTNCCLFIL